jgi:hypothetical protein
MNEFIEGALEKSTGLYCNLLIFTHIFFFSRDGVCSVLDFQLLKQNFGCFVVPKWKQKFKLFIYF